MKELLLGIDLGTGGCKVSVIEPNGNCLAAGFSEYNTFHPYPGWSEQDPEDWYTGFRKALSQVLTVCGVNPKRIVGIGVDASTHNAVLLDSNMKILRRCIMWTDQRSTQEVKWLNDRFREEIYQITYQRPSPTWTLPQLLWIRKHERDVFDHTRYLMFTKDFLRYRLTDTWQSDFIDAQGSMLYDMKRRGWSERICEIGSIPMSVLPPLVEPTHVIGGITEIAARETGLVPGTPIIVGASDTAVETYGVGAIDPGQCIIKIATAGTVNVLTSEPHPNPKALTYAHIIPGIWYTCLGTNSAAESMRWFRDTFYSEEKEEPREEPINQYNTIDRKAEKVNIGSDGLFFHPYLMGERSPYWDPDLRASFIGISSYHNKGHFGRAILEGVAFSLKDCFEVIEQMGLAVKEIRVIGGGAKSILWRKILSDVVGRPLLKLENDDASFGAAMLAGVGVGIFSDLLEATKKCVRIVDQMFPDQKNVKLYQQMFVIYRQIHDNLVNVYKLLGKDILIGLL